MSSVLATPHVGDIGVSLRCTVKAEATDGTLSDFDVTTYTTLAIDFKKPDETIVTKTATVVAATTNKLEYVTPDATLLDQYGTWYRRPHVSKTGSDVKGTWIEMEVEP